MAVEIDVRNLTKKFRDITAVEDLTFQVEQGEIMGLLGPNGAGKTTTMRMLSCLLPPSSGSAIVSGNSITDPNGSLEIRKIIGVVPDNVGLYDSLSAVKNLRFYGRMYESPESLIEANIKKYLQLMDLWEARDRPVGTYSKGMKQKVALARALIHDPRILFLDEPTANLDPEATKTIRDLIVSLKEQDRTILLNTHNLDEAQRICGKIGVLKTRLIAVDTPAQLEKSFSGNKVAVQLVEVNDRIMEAVRFLKLGQTVLEGNTIIIDLADPDRDTPSVVNAITAAGGKIRSVNEVKVSLEDAYFKVVKGD